MTKRIAEYPSSVKLEVDLQSSRKKAWQGPESVVPESPPDYYCFIVRRLPLPAIYAGAAIGGVALGVALFLVFSGGGSDSMSVDEDPGIPSDPRSAKILAFVPGAIERFSTNGAGGLYVVMSQKVQAVCSEEQFREALADQSNAANYKSVDRIVFSDDTADIDLTLTTPAGDAGVTWKAEILANGVVRLLEVPGSDECRAP